MNNTYADDSILGQRCLIPFVVQTLVCAYQYISYVTEMLIVLKLMTKYSATSSKSHVTKVQPTIVVMPKRSFVH